jgi:pimeloyl-ACP methyl ester carboxylesterase
MTDPASQPSVGPGPAPVTGAALQPVSAPAERVQPPELNPRPSPWRRLLTAPAVLVFGIILVLVGGFVANTAQTAGGTIRVSQVSFPTASGDMMTGLLYVPATATAKTPAPGVVAIEGYINSADTMDGFAIEMARRGAVVLAANQTGQGGSAPPAFATAFGGPPALAYLSSLSIVRHGDIGLIGHSMGGWASVLAAASLPTSYRSIALISSSVSTPVYEPVPGTPTFPRNVAVIEATNSEFSTLMWAVPKGTDIPKSPRLEQMFGTKIPVVPGRVYGSVAKGTGRVLYLEDAIHPGLTFDPTAIQNAVSWMQKTLIGTTSLPATNQIWLWDEVGTFLGLVGALLLLFGVGGTLLRTRFFASVARRRPESRSLRGLSWWPAAAVLVALGPLTFFWFQTWGQKQFPAGSIFPESITTGIAVWALGDAFIGAALFALWHFLGARRRTPTLAAVGPQPAAGAPSALPVRARGYNRSALAAYGIAEPEGKVVDWGNIGKSFLLALSSVAAVYVAVFFFEWAWSSDVRIWVMNIKPVTPMYLPVFLSYLWPFFVYFLIVSTVVFGQLRPHSATLGRFMTSVTALLTVGYVALIGIEYGGLWATGQLTTATQPLLAIVGFQFIPLFIIVGTVLSYFFWKTGRIWSGVFAGSLLVTAMIVTNTALQGRPW